MRVPQHHFAKVKQRGAALMVMLVILVMGALTILVNSLSSTALKNARQEKTAAALAQAKEALIGRAIKDPNRPGSLPCPDLITNTITPILNIPNDGVADSLVGNHCPSYVGRLPWKTLGLPDLRDGDGERLWYALSPSVRDDNSAQPINSDTQGQFNITGNATIDNVVAIVLSPGTMLSSFNQVRDSANQNNAVNYLEGNNATNAATITSDITNGTYTSASTYIFTVNASSTIFNDSVLGITADQVFPTIEKRIAKEASNCLQDYASANLGRYPWAAPLGSATNSDENNTLFGRLPSAPFSKTKTYSSNTMGDQWPSTAACNTVAAWWANWKELLFYSVANSYQPANTAALATCSTCLTVNPPSVAADKKAVAVVAGKALPVQVRTTSANKALVTNYLEGNNATGGFEQNPRSTTFNDTLLFQ